jgi:hypothetical protein
MPGWEKIYGPDWAEALAQYEWAYGAALFEQTDSARDGRVSLRKKRYGCVSHVIKI